MRLFATLVALFLVSCVRPIERPFVPPLRHEDEPTVGRSPTEDAPFRTSAPALDGEPTLPQVSVEYFTLDNGLRGIVVPRHGFPMIAARLIIDTRAFETGDVGGRRAGLMSALFLSPPEGQVRTSASCGTAFCSLGSVGTSDQLGEVLGRIANLATRDDRPEGFYKQRLADLVPLGRQSAQDPALSFGRIASALLFGERHRYGQRAPADSPSLLELKALRRGAFKPKQAWLLVVGDISLDEATAEARRRFGAWQGDSRTADSAPDPPAPLYGPRIAAFHTRALTQVTGGIFARGPAPADSDYLAFQILAELLGGGWTSEAFQHVREEMTAAYSVGAWITWYPEVSMIGLGGSFEPNKAIDGLNRLLECVRAARDGSPAPESLERAKRALIARWRQAMTTDGGITDALTASAIQGVALPQMLDVPARVRRVKGSDVQAAARRFLAVDALRVVLVGDPEFLVEAEALHFGVPTRVDGFGRPL